MQENRKTNGESIALSGEFQDSPTTFLDENDPKTAIRRIDRNERNRQSSGFPIPGEVDEDGTLRDDAEAHSEEVPRKRIRVRVPVVRSKSDRQHKVTVVRRRPVAPNSESTYPEMAPNAPRRVVITRVRSLRPVDALQSIENSLLEDVPTGNGRHRITVTRRRKINPTSIADANKQRVTRKKLVKVRPVVEPTPTLAIITTGFYTAPSPDVEDDPAEEFNEDVKSENGSIPTPDLEDTPNAIDNKPETILNELGTPSRFELELPEEASSQKSPVILTDNFFLPPSDEDEEYEDDYLEDELNPLKNNAEDPVEEEESVSIDPSTQIDGKDQVVKNETLPSDVGHNVSSETPSVSLKPFEANVGPNITESSKTIQSSFKADSDDDSDGTTMKPNHSVALTSQDSSVEPVKLDDSSLDPVVVNSNESDGSSQNPDTFDVPTVIPLNAASTSDPKSKDTTNDPETPDATTFASPTPEDIEGGLSDDLYLSLSRPDFPDILPSKPTIDSDTKPTQSHDSIAPILEPSTSVYYTETVVTSTRLRTYTYVVTKLNGLETEVTSSTTVRPRVTTLTLTVPVTVTLTVTPTMVPPPPPPPNSVSPVYIPPAAVDAIASEDAMEEEEGRRFNLATRVMSNGVEVIVARPTPALRWENANPQQTLTLSDTVLMLMPQDKPHEFVTKTCTTTFTYLSTFTKDGITRVSTHQQVVANTATEERHRMPPTEAAGVTLEASPILRTEVFKTTYTYLTLNTDHPDAENALESSTRVIANTVTAPQHYLDMILEPSETPRPETNTYLSTRMLEKTFTEDGKTRIETIGDVVTQLVVTQSAPPPRPTSVETTLTALDDNEELLTDIVKTYYITYTYYSTFLEKGNTIVHTKVSTSSDIVTEKVPVRKPPMKPIPVTATPEPIQIFATKTYLTTFTYFTTLLQAGPDGETLTTVSSRSQIVENVVTESIAPNLLDAGYMSALLTTAHHSDPVNNVVTGSTIIFFDEEDQIDPTGTKTMGPHEATALATAEDDYATTEPIIASPIDASNGASLQSEEQIAFGSNGTVVPANGPAQVKRPSTTQTNGGQDIQVSDLLNLGSLGINSLTALGPVITAMAGLLKGKTSASRRNDSVLSTEPQDVTTQRSPIYIPVAEFADGDIETAESQNIAAQLANLNHNYIPETRHKVAASLADGIPISPGEVITANSDVIIGKPGKMGPRPPQTFLKDGEGIGMKPPPLPVPNIPVHPVHEVIKEQDLHTDSQGQQTIQNHQGPQVQILSAHQIYEEHLKIPVGHQIPVASQVQVTPKYPQKLHLIQATLPKRTGVNHDIIEHDPLLKPPSRPNVEHYANPNPNPNEPDWSPDKYRRPWSAKDPLEPLPGWVEDNANESPTFDKMESPLKLKPWANAPSSEDLKRPAWAQKDPLLPDTPIVIETSEPKPRPPEPIVHHNVPHVIDRSTGQPLLVNIQPSQVANVVIPQGGTQALIFGDTNEPHISGQYFDDPSPYPEPEVGPGFIGIEKVEDLPQFSKENDPVDYMVPPSPPLNFKPLHQRPGSGNHPHTIPLSNHFDSRRPQGDSEIPVLRPEKRPEIQFIQRPDAPGLASGQGHVHTEILVHHRPETVNLRPQPIPHPSVLTHVNTGHQIPPRRDYTKPQRPTESAPPRRTEVPIAPEMQHQYIFLGKPTDSGNEVTINPNWKSDKNPSRLPPMFSPRPRPSMRPRPPVRSTTKPHNHMIYIERPGGHPIRKPQYSGPHRTPLKPHGNLLPPNWTPPKTPFAQEPPKGHVQNVQHEIITEAVPEEPIPFGHHSQVDLQDRPPHLYSGKIKTEGSTTTETHTENIGEHVPTGAVEYHNPSSDPEVKPEDALYYPQIPTIKPEVQSFGQILPQPERDPEIWQFNTQTEKTLIPSDSDVGESENVKVQNHIYDQGDKVLDEIDKQDNDDVIISANPHLEESNVTLQIENAYGTVGSVNTVVGRPIEVEQGITYGQKDKTPFILYQGVPFAHHEKEAPIIQGVPFIPDYYNKRPYETPVVQGKPFGVYSGHVDPGRPYGYNQKDNRPMDYDVVQGVPFGYHGNQPNVHQINKIGSNDLSTPKPHAIDDTIDLKPPAIIPQFGPESVRPNRPNPRPQIIVRPETRPPMFTRPEIITKAPGQFPPGLGQVITDQVQIRPEWNINQQGPEGGRPQQHLNRPESRPEHGIQSDSGVKENIEDNQTIAHSEHVAQEGNGNPGTHLSSPEYSSIRPEIGLQPPDSGIPARVHPEYPNIITKPRPQVPGPITISSGASKPDPNGRPNIQFSLPVEATGEEGDNDSQTERPPSMLVTKNTLKTKPNDESLETAFQTNFATPDSEEDDLEDQEDGMKTHIKNASELEVSASTLKPRVPSQDMMPPPLRPAINVNIKNNGEEEGLKPPPLPSDVVGLSPPPVAITTTNRPIENEFYATVNTSGLRPPPKYIPLDKSVGMITPPAPSVSMVPPNLRPTIDRPFLADLLSQDMVPPPPVLETSTPLEITTVRPAVAVSGSIQIATVVATSHIPVIQDIESKIPIIHGTVDLPVVVDVPEILRPAETRKTEHVSIYTVRPFETRPVSRVSVQPTAILTTNLVMPTILRPPQIDHIEPSRSSVSHEMVQPTRLTSEILSKPTKRPDRPVFLQPSKDHVLPSTRIEPTESLTYIVGTDQKNHQTLLQKDDVTNVHETHNTEMLDENLKVNIYELPKVVTRIDSAVTKATTQLFPKFEDSKVDERPNKASKEIVGTVIHEVVKDRSTATMEMKPMEVTRYKTLTVTRTETSVLGSPPTTRTLLLTHTLTSTMVETVTETLLRPTLAVATITATVLQPVTRIPSAYENVEDNDSIFVVMSDQKPPAPGAEEVEAEYGEDEVSRDEQDPAGNEIHRVLAGGILGAPVIPLEPAVNQCLPECRASKAEVCAEVDGEMRCVCRPGFARMFPDRPCKPTYTYTLRIGLDRIGRDPIFYDKALNDSTSTTYRRLAGAIKDALDRTLMQSDLRDLYRGLNIAGFTPNPPAVEFHVQLSENANETRLKEVLRKYLVGSNYSLGGTEVYAARNLDLVDARDFDECATEEGGPHHDCSPHAACFNLRGSYQCSCREGWADISDNLPAYPGRLCSQAPLGCAGCNNKGHCLTNTNGQEVCECFPWHSGQRCQVNLKVLLIALVTTGAILLGLLAVCVGLACFRRPGRKPRSGDRRAMIAGTGGDTSSEGSIADLAIPHHVPHVLPPPPQMIAPAPPNKKPARKVSGKPRQPRKPSVPTPGQVNDDQRDRSLTVMIPRAKYRSAPQSPQIYKPVMSTFAADEHKLISYLEGGPHPGNRKPSLSSNKDYKEPDLQVVRTPVAPSGALVSAGFQVSATVTRPADAESTLARSCGETTVEPSTKLLRNTDLPVDLGSTLARSCGETTIQAPTKLLRLDLGETGSTLARSCGETTIQAPTKLAAGKRRSGSSKDREVCRDNNRDNASDGHTMAERDLGSTLRLPAQHPPLYNPDRASDRESNFDSL